MFLYILLSLACFVDVVFVCFRFLTRVVVLAAITAVSIIAVMMILIVLMIMKPGIAADPRHPYLAHVLAELDPGDEYTYLWLVGNGGMG